MTLEEYRIKHSMLIEQYQWIEFDLEGLYAALSDEPFHKALQEIERDTIGGVVREIQAIERKQNIVVFTEAEYQQIDQLRERRNFWSHAVQKRVRIILFRLKKAESVLERLRQIKAVYMAQNRDKIIRSLRF